MANNLILMSFHDEGSWHNALGLLLSAFVNGAIYALAGLVVGAIVKLIFGLRNSTTYP
jgi:hypothetical protein